MPYRKKLIQVALPLEAINAASARVTRHCEERSDEAISTMREGDCFASLRSARNDSHEIERQHLETL